MRAPGIYASLFERVCFDPVTTAVITAVGTAVSAIGAISSGNAQASASLTNAEMSRRQGEAYRVQADQSREAAAANEADYRRRALRVLSSQQAAIGASGVTVEGSPLLGLADSAAESELDALRIRHAGEVQAGQAEFAATQADAQSALDRLYAREARMRGYANAASSLLTGGSRVYSLMNPAQGAAGSAAGTSWQS